MHNHTLLLLLLRQGQGPARRAPPLGPAGPRRPVCRGRRRLPLHPPQGGRRNPVVEAGLRRAGLLTAVGGGAAAVVGLRGGVRGLEVVLLALEEGRGGGGDPAGVRGAPVEQRRAFLLFKQLVFQIFFFIRSDAPVELERRGLCAVRRSSCVRSPVPAQLPEDRGRQDEAQVREEIFKAVIGGRSKDASPRNRRYYLKSQSVIVEERLLQTNER